MQVSEGNVISAIQAKTVAFLYGAAMSSSYSMVMLRMAVV